MLTIIITITNIWLLASIYNTLDMATKWVSACYFYPPGTSDLFGRNQVFNKQHYPSLIIGLFPFILMHHNIAFMERCKQ